MTTQKQQIEQQIAKRRHEIQILEAFAAGRKLQFWNKAFDRWEDRASDDNLPIIDVDTYRIAPEPRVRWFNEYPDTDGRAIRGIHNLSYNSKANASNCASGDCLGQVKFVEVLDE